MKKEPEKIEQVEDDSDEEILIRPKKAPVPVAEWKPADLVKVAAGALEELRAKKPLVACLTNAVSANFTANGLLALGAAPVMVTDSGEATSLAATADALLVNTGTLDKAQAESMRAAVARANASGRPWTLDPVGVGALPLRNYLAKELMRRFPALIRGNASEINYLAGAETGGRGVDTLVSSDTVVDEARRLAQVTHAAVLVTGATDYVFAEAQPCAAVSNGSPLMTRVAGIGCAQGAFAGAFLAALGRNRRFEATVATALVTAIAGELAAAKAKNPGSFAVAFLDALDAVTPNDVVKRAKLEIR